MLVSEEVFVEFVFEKSSDIGEDGVFEDMVDAGGRGGSGGKKEVLFSKIVTDGKLVKGTLLLLSEVLVLISETLF